MPGISEHYDQFEIFLKTENNDVKVSRETDKTPMMKSLIDRISASDQKNCVVKGRLMKRPLRIESPEKSDGYLHPVNAERVFWSAREVEWFTSEKRLLFIVKNTLERDFWIMNILKASASSEFNI
jgi:molybdopterin-guanine dinucleotide biosynthesis protein